MGASHSAVRSGFCTATVLGVISHSSSTTSEMTTAEEISAQFAG